MSKWNIAKQALMQDPERATGRTTRLAIGIIAAAMSMDGEAISVEDHHGTREANRLLLMLVIHYVNKIELSGFSFSREHCTVTYNQPNCAKS